MSRSCESCEHFHVLLPNRANGYCYAPVPHSVPLQHRITNRMRPHDGKNCPSYLMASRIMLDEYRRRKPAFVVLED